MLLQSFLTRILGTKPTLLYSGSRITSVNLLRQYATTTSKTKPKSTTSKTKPKSTKPKNTSKESSKKKKDKKDKKPKKDEQLPELFVPEEPKRPPTAYSLFYRDFFHKERSKVPADEKIIVTQFAKSAGEEWSKLSEDEKKAYVEKQKKSASEYARTHKEWLESLTPVQIAHENKRRKGSRKNLKLIKDPAMPKRPRTPYINYVIEHIAMSDEKGPSRMKAIANQWKSLSDEEKKPYADAFAKDKERYKQEITEYKKNFEVKQ